MAGTDQPAVRWELPYELVESGRATTLLLQLYRDGVPVVPASVTVALYDESGAAVTIGSPTATANGFQVVVPASPALALGARYRIEWTPTMAGGETHVYDTPVAVCRRVLFTTVSGFDIRRRWPHLDPDVRGSMVASATNHQPQIDHAWWTIQRKLIDMGRRPWMILGPSALHEAHELLSGALIHEYLASRGNEAMRQMGENLRHDYERALSRLTIEYDSDENGTPDDSGGRESVSPTVWLGAAPDTWGGRWRESPPPPRPCTTPWLLASRLWPLTCALPLGRAACSLSTRTAA